MKTFTSIEQSKKLVDILPLESADMIFQLGENKYADSIRVPLTKKHWGQMMPDIIPCWSLAALLNILPSSTLDSSDDHHYRVHCRERFTEWHDNAIDSCVEMIIRLHDKGLL